MTLPAVTRTPCDECPWRRNATKGWLGPHSAEEWCAIAHSDAPIACHQTLEGDQGFDSPDVRQCAGAAIFRANVCKSPRDPEVARGKADRERVFSWDNEFIEHHADSPLAKWLEGRRDEEADR